MSHSSRYTSQSVKSFAGKVLRGFGCDESEADIVASHLVDANLTGHDSHGIGMLPLYGEQVLDGNLIPNQQPLLHEPVGAICSACPNTRSLFWHCAIQVMYRE